MKSKKKILHVFTLTSTASIFFDGQFKYLSDNGYEIHLVASPSDIKEFANRNNIIYHPIEIARRIDIKTDLKSIYQLIKLIKKEKIEIVFGHTPKGALVAMMSAWIYQVPKRVYYRHGLIYTTAKGIRRKLFKTIERITSLLSTNIINVSQSLSDLALTDKLNSKDKQQIIGSGTCGGIDTKNIFNPELIRSSNLQELRDKLKISKKDIVFGFCGRICKDKGIEELINGFKQFKSKNPEQGCKLLLVGSFDQRDILKEELKKEIEENEDILSVGNIKHELLPEYYALMDVFVLPSYREGFGISVLEASAMEIPILVSRSHGCIDSIIEKKTGEYIDISPEGVYEGMKKMVETKNRKEYGKNGRKWVLENFDYSVMWPKIKEMYTYITK